LSTGVALGHRRLSIIDVAGGKQPLSNEDGSVWVVFNGEIYNFRDLRGRLESAGHQFRTQSDTECCHLYEDEGPEFLGQLNGMFALALWDARRQQLLLARDRLERNRWSIVANRAADVCQRVEGAAASAGRAAGDRPAGAR